MCETARRDEHVDTCFGGGSRVALGEVAGVGEHLARCGPAVGDRLVEHRGERGGIRRGVPDPGGDDHLMGVVDHRLGVVALVEAVVGRLHDPAVGIGEVPLRLVLRCRLTRCFLTRPGRSCLVAAPSADPLLGFGRGACRRFGFEIGLRPADLGQARRPSGQLPGQVIVATVWPETFILGGVGRFRLGQHVVDLAGQVGFAFGHPLVGHGLAATGVGPHLRPVQRHPTHPDHARLAAQHQRLEEQGLQRLEVAAAEPGHGPVIRGDVRGQEPERHIVMARLLDPPRRTHPRHVAVDQQLQHQARVIRRKTPTLDVRGEERLQAEPVKAFETTSHADLMSASGDGSLIQATVGSFGG